jgi:small-conductance mechanosensitive channel
MWLLTFAADDASLETADLGTVLLACAAAAGVAFAVGLVLTLGLRWVGKRTDLTVQWTRLWRSPIVLLFVVIAVREILHDADAQRGWTETALHVLDVALILVVAWILVVAVQILEQAALQQHPETGLANQESRHSRTKITLLRRVSTAIIATSGVVAVLWTFPTVRQLGVGLLASAGVVGIVFGLAAQTSLANIFAGVQIAFTDGIRIEDIVEIEGQTGRIEEITLTYVTVRLWEGSSLILPCTYFTTTPFRNWTHHGTATTATVQVGADWNVPVDELRAELKRALEASPNWDGVRGELHVDDASGQNVKLIAVFSAADWDTATMLRWEVREALFTYLKREHPESRPRV